MHPTMDHPPLIIYSMPMANKENQRPGISAPIPISSISSSNKPALSQQRDHSACRKADTPLKVRKTRENLKQYGILADIPPPCVHHDHDEHQLHSIDSSNTSFTNATEPCPGFDTTYGGSLKSTLSQEHVDGSTVTLPVTTMVHRQKSVRQRMLSKVKGGLTIRTKSSQNVGPSNTEVNLVRRFSGRRQMFSDTDQRSQSFETSRGSVESDIDEGDEMFYSTALVKRTVTDSTVSTTEVFEGSMRDEISHDQSLRDGTVVKGSSQKPTKCPEPSDSPLQDANPRPPPMLIIPMLQKGPRCRTLIMPYVELVVTLDSSAIDIHRNQDVWVTIEAFVRGKPVRIPIKNDMAAGVSDNSCGENISSSIGQAGEATDIPNGPHCGKITDLSLSFKPLNGCQITACIGHRPFKNLTIGDECISFVRLRVPEVRTSKTSFNQVVTELESMIGTLEKEVLRVEARCRHMALPSDNIVTVRHVCTMNRPMIESRWSNVGPIDDVFVSPDAHKKLASYIYSHHTPEIALDMMEKAFGVDVYEEGYVYEVTAALKEEVQQRWESRFQASRPSVVVTDLSPSSEARTDSFTTALSTPRADQQSRPMEDRTTTSSPTVRITSSTLLPPLFTDSKATTATSTPVLAPPLFSTLRPTTAKIDATLESAWREPQSRAHDAARELWRHIRQSSLSTNQSAVTNSQQLNYLKASDDTVKELHQRALANKRSVGAETLREWKWDEQMNERSKD